MFHRAPSEESINESEIEYPTSVASQASSTEQVMQFSFHAATLFHRNSTGCMASGGSGDYSRLYPSMIRIPVYHQGKQTLQHDWLWLL